MKLYKVNSDLQRLVKDADASLAKSLNSSSPKMTAVNSMLKYKAVHDFVWQVLQMPDECSMPLFGKSNFLYGKLSEFIHYPSLQTVICSDKDPDNWRRFFKALAERLYLEYIEFDDIKAESVPDNI